MAGVAGMTASTLGASKVGGAYSASALLRWQFRLAHARLDMTIDWLGAEPVSRHPFASTAAAHARYAQIVVSEDLSVNGVLAGAMPLALSTWAGRTGLSEMPPLGESCEWRAWAREVRLDLAALRAYARAVYAATDIYIAALPDEALDVACREAPVCLLSALLLTLAMRHGEISCLLALDDHRPPADGMLR